MVRFVKRRVQWESEVVTMDQSLVNACRLGYAASVYDRFRVHRYRRPLTAESETQLQQSRSQFASCLAKRLNGKGVTIWTRCTILSRPGRTHAGVVGHLDAACHHGQVRQRSAT